MLARICGVLESIEGNAAVIWLGAGSGPGAAGLAYEVLLPAFLAQRLIERIGQHVSLHTIEVLEPQGQSTALTPRLIGFSSAEERRFFTLFTTVKGVGTRRALRAMALPVPAMAQAIARRDAAALKALPEIGSRLAETVIAELNGKVDSFAAGEPEGATVNGAVIVESEAVRQAVAALVRLGETQAQAAQLVRRASESEASLVSADGLLTAALGLR